MFNFLEISHKSGLWFTTTLPQQFGCEDFEKIGRGRYSEVYKACDLLTNETVVVKMLKPVKKEKVRRELMVLEAVRDSPYIIKLID